MLDLWHMRIGARSNVLYLYRLLGGIAFEAIGTNFLLSEAHAA
jgi:hypothetical protein